ncbi:hypothetical protein CMV_015770 [Castanea mollissima]|uniref:Uncharacterized protein n=1 Tax=Castanea mollissima TaxID=60419 RepID=A0A8J4QUN4_9ROSI|nr:hypothetical protein CMV_015770 [Castanea mollissima]
MNNYWAFIFADSEWFDQSYLLHSYSGSATVREDGSWTSCFELRLFGVEQVLAMTLGANRMIIGGWGRHVIQEIGINGVCNNQAIWIDVGMLKLCSNGLLEQVQVFDINPVVSEQVGFAY